MVYIITHAETSYRVIIMANLGGEAMVVAEVITVAMVTVDQLLR